MALSKKIISPTYAPAHGDIAPYFFSDIIFRSDGGICVSMTPFWMLGPFGGYVTETHISPSDRFFFRNSMWRYLLDQAHVLVKGICCSVPSDGVSPFVRN